LIPDWGDVVDSVVGLSYRSARLNSDRLIFFCYRNYQNIEHRTGESEKLSDYQIKTSVYRTIGYRTHNELSFSQLCQSCKKSVSFLILNVVLFGSLPTPFRQQVASLSQSPFVSLVELTYGGGRRSQIIRQRENPILHNSLTTGTLSPHLS
jgi:hypothetical protein